MYAVISPRDCTAGLLRDGVVHILDCEGEPTTSMSEERFLSIYPDSLVVEVDDGSQASDILEQRERRSLCLDMALLLFDPELSIHTRRKLAEELNILLQDDTNRDFVLNIILSRPLPSSADLLGALEATEGISLASDILTTIDSGQEMVHLVMEAWLRAIQNPIVKQSGPENVFALFCRHGVFRRLVLEAVDQSKLATVRSELAMDLSLRNQMTSAPRIVLALVDELDGKLPYGSVTQRASQRQVEPDTYEVPKIADAKPQHTSVHDAFVAAISQVEKCAELYIQEKDAQANVILKSLVAEQKKHSSGEQYLVKSLCNMAKLVGVGGRPEIGLKLLVMARDLPKGNDARLHYEIGNQWRYVDKFDEAMESYKEARRFDDGSLADKIRLAEIRLTVAKGSYKEALSQYLSIDNLDMMPHEQFGLGTLYRKMGDFRASREMYRRCIGIDESFHKAVAGLAEILKQTGRPHQAIAKYNTILSEFKNIEDGQRKVYKLAQSNLFRLTNQYDKSERVLSDLLKEFKSDPSVHLQLAKLFALKKEFDKAQKHYEISRRWSKSDLSNILYSMAANPDGQNEIAVLESNSFAPEEIGLANCLQAYDLIKRSDYATANQLLKHTGFVDRIVRDFSGVLRFHALRQMSPRFNYKSDHALCLVAKRGERGLRHAMTAIDSNAFAMAKGMESEFLLRYAV